MQLIIFRVAKVEGQTSDEFLTLQKKLLNNNYKQNYQYENL